MGSLGSHTINQKMMDILPKFNGKDYEVLFVTGKNYYEELQSIFSAGASTMPSSNTALTRG